jgi:hypothetical protein
LGAAPGGLVLVELTLLEFKLVCLDLKQVGLLPG